MFAALGVNSVCVSAPRGKNINWLEKNSYHIVSDRVEDNSSLLQVQDFFKNWIYNTNSHLSSLHRTYERCLLLNNQYIVRHAWSLVDNK